jgi:phosphate uptake regulator
MESRKIQLVGNRSYSISLPKQWVISNNLKQKDSVFIEIDSNNELVIRGIKLTKDEKSRITVNLEEIDDIKEFLMFCYIKNIDNIRLLTKNQDYEKIKSIKNILNYLEGYDIVSEDENKIEISFLFNDININIQKILARMTYLLKLLLTSLQNKDKAILEETETSIDRLYHLSKRILFSCIHNQKLRTENKINNSEDIFFYKDIFKRLENIGDQLVKLKNNNISNNETKIVTEFIDFLYQLLIRKQNPHELKKYFVKIKIRSPNSFIKNILTRIDELCTDVLENAMSIEFNNNYFDKH